MTVMLAYDCTVARFLPLLCSLTNLLIAGVPVKPAGTPEFTTRHALRSEGTSREVIPSYHVSTKSWPALPVRSTGTAFKPSTIHRRVSAGSMTASISR